VSQRPVIVAIDEDADGNDLRVTIALDWNDERFYGHAVGEATGDQRARLAGEATLRALEHICGDRIDLELLAVATQDLGLLQIALAQVRLGDDETLIGNAVLTPTEPALAAARAVMDALNRRLGLVL
jgi:hypothetical protein